MLFIFVHSQRATASKTFSHMELNAIPSNGSSERAISTHTQAFQLWTRSPRLSRSLCSCCMGRTTGWLPCILHHSIPSLRCVPLLHPGRQYGFPAFAFSNCFRHTDIIGGNAGSSLFVRGPLLLPHEKHENRRSFFACLSLNEFLPNHGQQDGGRAPVMKDGVHLMPSQIYTDRGRSLVCHQESCVVARFAKDL